MVNLGVGFGLIGIVLVVIGVAMGGLKTEGSARNALRLGVACVLAGIVIGNGFLSN